MSSILTVQAQNQFLVPFGTMTGDPLVLGVRQDSLVMNLDDLACVGAWDRVMISSTINQGARNFPEEALAALIEGTEEFLQSMRKWGFL